MKLDANNNGRIIYRIARSNLTGSKVYTLFSGLTIILSITFIMVMTLFLQGTQTAEERMLQNMQHVIYMNVSKERMEELAADERTELVIPYKLILPIPKRPLRQHISRNLTQKIVKLSVQNH